MSSLQPSPHFSPRVPLRRRLMIALGLVILTSTTTLSNAATPENAMPENSVPETASTASMEERCRREILELHQFFQDWFNATLESTDEEFARFAGVMAEGFTMVSPGGRVSERDSLLTGLRGAHGRWSGEPGRIWIENFTLRRLAGEVAVVTYEEWQDSAEGKRGRLSTALFEPREGAPNGVVWLHVHETWLPSRE